MCFSVLYLAYDTATEAAIERVHMLGIHVRLCTFCIPLASN